MRSSALTANAPRSLPLSPQARAMASKASDQRRIAPICSTAGELLDHRVLDHGALEEVRVERGVQTQRVGEEELAELVRVDQPVLDQLVGLLQHPGHVHDVEVAHVGAEDRTQTMLGAEGPGGDGVVGLAPEEEALA